jgi:hypothetical protein
MAGETPKQTYRQPWSNVTGEVYADPFGRTYGNEGPMGRTPAQSGVWNEPDPSATPNANAAAVRAYTRNAPYMQDFMSNPQDMVLEMAALQRAVEKDPNDVVSEYRLRVLRQALGDVFGMRVPEQIYGYGVTRAQAPATPGSPFGSPKTPGSE